MFLPPSSRKWDSGLNTPYLCASFHPINYAFTTNQSNYLPASATYVNSSFSTNLTLYIKISPLHHALPHIPPHCALFLFLPCPRHPSSMKHARHSRVTVAFLFCRSKPELFIKFCTFFFQFFSVCSVILSNFYSLCNALLLIHILLTFSFIKPNRAPIFLQAS